MTIKEIDRQIRALQEQRRQLEEQERTEFIEEAKKNIGRCFILNHKTYVKVLNAPQPIYGVNTVHFNQYQYPAIYLEEEDGMPFHFGNLFSGAWGVGNDASMTTYEEISHEEFNAEFDKRMDKFTKKIEGV